MRQMAWAFLAGISMWMLSAACQPEPESRERGGDDNNNAASNSTSGGNGSSSGGGGLATYTDFCVGLAAQVTCKSPACGAFDEARCRTEWTTACQTYGSEVAAAEADGLTHYNPSNAAECLEAYSSYAESINKYRCGEISLREFFTVLFGYDPYGAPACTNGKRDPVPQFNELFSPCESTVQGTLALGRECADNYACSSNNCEDRPDGGCGSCGERREDEDSERLPEGATCRFDYDGGSRTEACEDGLTCDDSDKCVPYAAAGEACGAGFMACAGGCGFACSGVDGGRDTCVPLPEEGEACGVVGGALRMCARGLTCVPRTDAGFPDFRFGRCVEHAAVGQTCSTGFNYDILLFSDYTGGFSYGSSAVCETRARCSNIPDGGTQGTCAVVPPPATGQPCDVLAEPPCASENDHCLNSGAGNVCSPLRQEGGVCFSEYDCEVPLWCDRPDGGVGTCREPLAVGENCGGGKRCETFSTCVEGECTALTDYAGRGFVCE